MTFFPLQVSGVAYLSGSFRYSLGDDVLHVFVGRLPASGADGREGQLSYCGVSP